MPARRFPPEEKPERENPTHQQLEAFSGLSDRDGTERGTLGTGATRISWSPLSGHKGVEPPLQFGEKTRDCSPGQAGKEGPHLTMTGASHGFPRAAAPVGVFSRGTTRTSGSLSCGAREVRSPCAWRGELVITLESWEGTWA